MHGFYPKISDSVGHFSLLNIPREISRPLFFQCQCTFCLHPSQDFSSPQLSNLKLPILGLIDHPQLLGTPNLPDTVHFRQRRRNDSLGLPIPDLVNNSTADILSLSLHTLYCKIQQQFGSIKDWKILEHRCPVADSVPSGQRPQFLEVLLAELDAPGLEVLLQAGGVAGLWDHSHPALEGRFEDDLCGGSAMFVGEVEDYLIFEDVYIVSVEAVSSDQWSMGDDCQSVLLREFNKGVVGQVRMHFDLHSYGLDLAKSQQFHQQLAVDVRNPKMLHIPLSHTQLHLCPELFQRLVVEFPLIIGINKRPMQVNKVQVLQLHQLKDLLDLMLHALSSYVAQFGGDEEFLALDSAFSDDCLDGVAQWDFVVIEASPVDVATCAQLQPLPQQFSQQLLVPEFVGAEALQLQHLLIGQRLKGWTLLLLALLLSHVSYIICVAVRIRMNLMDIQNQLKAVLR